MTNEEFEQMAAGRISPEHDHLNTLLDQARKLHTAKSVSRDTADGGVGPATLHEKLCLHGSMVRACGSTHVAARHRRQ